MPVPSGSDPSSLYGAELVNVPYVSPAMFKAWPTFAQVDNIVAGVVDAVSNLAELNTLLIEASQWATDQANSPLHAHVHVENKRLKVKRDGAFSWHPAHNPVRLVTALQYAYAGQLGDAGSVQTVTDLSGQWIEEGAQVFLPFPAMGTSLGGIQFGPPVQSSPMYTTWTYVAGNVVTRIAADVLAGASVLTVADPTGIQAGGKLMIWDCPASVEAVTVGTNYAVGSTTVQLSGPLRFAHTAANDVLIGDMPSSLQLAVVLYTASLLMRPDSTREDAFPDTRTGLTTRSEDARRDGTGLVAEAYRLIRSYQRVR